MNALVDRDVIEALYAAAQAGVPINLLIRGICCLRPGIPGVSERIQVRALIDRFLEHSRISWFKNGGHDEVYISSADWMPRNFHRRVEVLVPILDEAIRERLMREILTIPRTDNVKSWLLRADGSYAQVSPASGETAIRSQVRFMELAREKVKEADAQIRASGRFQFVQVHAPGKNARADERRRRDQQRAERQAGAKHRTR